MSGFKGSQTDESLGCLLFIIALAVGWYLFFDNGLSTLANKIAGG